jgi:hypothetical protein
MARKDSIHKHRNKAKKKRPGIHSKNTPKEKKYRGQGK